MFFKCFPFEPSDAPVSFTLLYLLEILPNCGRPLRRRLLVAEKNPKRVDAAPVEAGFRGGYASVGAVDRLVPARRGEEALVHTGRRAPSRCSVVHVDGHSKTTEVT